MTLFWVVIVSGANKAKLSFSDEWAAIAQAEFAGALGPTYRFEYATDEAHKRLSRALGVGQTRFS